MVIKLEYYDTSKDPRILFAEAVVKNIMDYFKSRKIQHVRREDFLKKLNNLCEIMKKIKWSYVSPRNIEERGLLDRLERELNELKGMVWPVLDKQDDATRKLMKFLVKTLGTLRERLVDQKLDISNIVATSYVKVMNVEKHPKARNLFIAWVTDGSETYEIVTNDPTVKRGEVLPLAFLPPKDLLGVISEGMFIGGKKRIRRVSEELVGQQPELDAYEKNKLKAEIVAAIKTITKK